MDWPIEFWKMNGSGNDFIIIDNRRGNIKEEEMPWFVKTACRRRTSVGADGVIFVEKSDKYDFAWRYFNADGGEVEMCGNGSRCVCRFAYLKGIAGPTMTFESLAGPITAEVKGRMVKVLMPEPTGLQLDLDMEKRPEWKCVDYVNTGVPHVVVTVENPKEFPVTEHGKWIRYHKKFQPDGTNANFISIHKDGRILIRTYERGVEGETLACGTGAVASALVASERGLARSPVEVKTAGGEVLIIHLEKNAGEYQRLWLEGSTCLVYKAELNREAVENFKEETSYNEH